MSSSKKSVSFNENNQEYQMDEDTPVQKTSSDGADVVKKHTLDSDEEDNGQDYDKLDEDDIEGQEDETIAFDGDIAITPFNMKEELETGHFDSMGTYIFDDKNDIKDSWIDNIDWVKVERNAKEKGATQEDSVSSDSEPEEIDIIPTFKEMIPLMKDSETVAKAIRRLGGTKKISSAERLKAKKLGIKPSDEEVANKKSFQMLTGLADKLIQAGYMGIYDETYEKLVYQIKRSETSKKEPNETDAALDMFGDDFNEQTVKEKEDSTEPKAKKSKTDTEELLSRSSNDVMWEYKLTDGDNEEIHGPYSSAEMQNKVENKTFPGSVYVRKVGSGSDFYSSKRIDFDLYT